MRTALFREIFREVFLLAAEAGRGAEAAMLLLLGAAADLGLKTAAPGEDSATISRAALVKEPPLILRAAALALLADMGAGSAATGEVRA